MAGLMQVSIRARHCLGVAPWGMALVKMFWPLVLMECIAAAI